MANRKRTSTVVTLPPPTGGWNTRDPLPSMPPEDAITLDNIVPGVGKVSSRGGYTSHATGLGTYIESLVKYSGITGSEKMFAAIPTAIYETTNAGAVGAAAVSGLTNGRWQHCMFGTSAGNFLVMCNGVDPVQNYDASSWTTPTINDGSAGALGLGDSTSLINVTMHLGRLWFAQNNTLTAWYLPTATISGTAVKFPLSQFCRLGGYLLAMASWTRDGGSGMDDYLVFITSNGEVIIYQGTDPASSATWALVGVFRIAEPIGRRCFVKAGADLAILTSVGLTPLSHILALNVGAQTNATLSSKISPSFANAYITSGDYHGWEVIEYPRANLIICNIPIAERVTQHQYIANTLTGAWARWKNLPSGCWALFGSDMYFGGNDGVVYHFDTGNVDNTTSISFLIQQAYSPFGTNGIKRFIAARPLALGPESYTPSVQFLVDYSTSPVTIPSTVSVSSESLWDVALWDVALWAGSSVPVARWQGINGIGYVGSLAIKDTMSQEFVLNQTDVLFEKGNYL